MSKPQENAETPLWLSNWYVDLVKRQRPLDADAEKVLRENLWDLYDTTKREPQP